LDGEAYDYQRLIAHLTGKKKKLAVAVEYIWRYDDNYELTISNSREQNIQSGHLHCCLHSYLISIVLLVNVKATLAKPVYPCVRARRAKSEHRRENRQICWLSKSDSFWHQILYCLYLISLFSSCYVEFEPTISNSRHLDDLLHIWSRRNISYSLLNFVKLNEEFHIYNYR
jgi:hypothetical protein